MGNNWLTQESPGLNPDWFSDIWLFSIKYVNIVLNIMRSKTLLQIERQVCSSNMLLLVFFYELVHLHFFRSDGKMPCVRQDFKIILRGLQLG